MKELHLLSVDLIFRQENCCSVLPKEPQCLHRGGKSTIYGDVFLFSFFLGGTMVKTQGLTLAGGGGSSTTLATHPQPFFALFFREGFVLLPCAGLGL
jgi:hypothetical protein